jgi:hypothetical protein
LSRGRVRVARGEPDYEADPHKNAVNSVFARAAVRRVRAGLARGERRARVMYLESAAGQTTRALLRAGVPRRMLVPVSWDPAACAAIYEAFPRIFLIQGAASDALDLLRTRGDNLVAAWFDYCGNIFGTQETGSERGPISDIRKCAAMMARRLPPGVSSPLAVTVSSPRPHPHRVESIRTLMRAVRCSHLMRGGAVPKTGAVINDVVCDAAKRAKLLAHELSIQKYSSKSGMSMWHATCEMGR